MAEAAENAAPLEAADLMFMENEHYSLVDALPYIDTQLGQVEVAQQVKGLIEEEMRLFEPRDYLERLPEPELPLLESELVSQEFDRVRDGRPLSGVDLERYRPQPPQAAQQQDASAWKKAAEAAQMQLEYNRLRLTNLEMLERWGSKAWVAHSTLVRVQERVRVNEATKLRTGREEVNKKRKLDQISCGNELRKLGYELEQFTQDNYSVEIAVRQMESEVKRLRAVCKERGVELEADLRGDEDDGAEAAAAGGDGDGE